MMPQSHEPITVSVGFAVAPVDRYLHAAENTTQLLWILPDYNNYNTDSAACGGAQQRKY